MTAKTAGSLKAAEEAIAYAKRLRGFIINYDIKYRMGDKLNEGE